MSSMNMVDDQLGRIATGNRYYSYNRAQWRYYLESYLGGEDYKRGQHLNRYELETDAEYAERLRTTPLENHVKAVVDVYNSFLFRQQPEREYGSIANLPELEAFLEDCDMEGRNLNTFMKDVSTWASVFGHTWILIAKPKINAVTRADEIAAGVRPYLNLLTPLNVLDWRWERSDSGYYDLRYLKYIEDINGSIQTIKEWHLDTIVTHEVNFDTREILGTTEEVNELGIIPAVCAYSTRSAVRGIGVGDVGDISDIQKYIYNMLSEVEQTIRLDSHPSLVKTPETVASAGAGSIVHMPDNLDPGLKPFLLEYGGASVDSIYKAIEHAVDSIDKLSNTGGIRATSSRSMSGLALQTEFQLLNARLSEKADNLELAEEQMWKLWCMYQGVEWDGEITYEDSYSIQDEQQQYQNLQIAKASATSPIALAVIDQKIVDLMTDDTGIEDKIYIPLPAIDPTTVNGYVENPGQNMVDDARSVERGTGDAEEMSGLPAGNSTAMTTSSAVPVSQAIPTENLSPVNAPASMPDQPGMMPAPKTPVAQAVPYTGTNPIGSQVSQKDGEACPIATQDISVNIKNRQKAINQANYGPLNPALPNRTFWMAKAQIFNTTVAEAKTSRCGNCAAFCKTTKMLDCIEQGLAAGGSGSQDAWDVIATADLGYCEIFDFKCAATRTCDAWVTGGPITDQNESKLVGK